MYFTIKYQYLSINLVSRVGFNISLFNKARPHQLNDSIWYFTVIHIYIVQTTIQLCLRFIIHLLYTRHIQVYPHVYFYSKNKNATFKNVIPKFKMKPNHACYNI
jgi:hypothetical protein